MAGILETGNALCDGIYLGRTPLGMDMLRSAEQCLQLNMPVEEYLTECRAAWNEACDNMKVKP